MDVAVRGGAMGEEGGGGKGKGGGCVGIRLE